MKLPIIAYGNPVLRQKAKDIDANYPELDTLIKDMFDTMYAASGVGIAAPQIGKSIRLFVIDASPYDDEEASLKDFKKVFINARILEESGDKWLSSEGCLSIPDIREDVSRHPSLTISYFDENWVQHEETYSGLAARIIQHEYDHIEGILFTDHLSALKKRLLKGRLTKITKGDVDADYRMKFPVVSRR